MPRNAHKIKIGDLVRMSDQAVFCYETVGRKDLLDEARKTYMIVVETFICDKTAMPMFKVLCAKSNLLGDLYEADIQRVF
tara:strand:+ start:253 stop:492 length:240 start_codon:yes stop_codon:yes gene_type:complete